LTHWAITLHIFILMPDTLFTYIIYIYYLFERHLYWHIYIINITFIAFIIYLNIFTIYLLLQRHLFILTQYIVYSWILDITCFLFSASDIITFHYWHFRHNISHITLFTPLYCHINSFRHLYLHIDFFIIFADAISH
jgi:hypothetical protein